MASNGVKQIVIRNGTLIDGTGQAPTHNDAIVIEGKRIRSIGQLPGDVKLEDQNNVHVVDATGQWIMPGLIDAHCHLSFGHPQLPEDIAPDAAGYSNPAKTTSPEFSAIRAARNAQTVLRSGVTSISVPGGTWFIDVAVRNAIKAGIIEGPRIFCAGRFVITYGSIADDQPSWVGTPEHTVGVLTHGMDDLIDEVRRQCKHGVNFIKLADSILGDTQTLSPEEVSHVVQEAHRRNVQVAIHARGSGSTRAAAEAGVDWIMHADLATEADLEAVAERDIRIVPALTFMFKALEHGREYGNMGEGEDPVKRNMESSLRNLERARKMGIKVLAGTDSGNSPIMPYGQYHADEAEILVRHAGFTPMEAIVASTKNNAFVVGLENEVGVVEAGKVADIIILKDDPLADIRVLQGGRNLAMVMKDGKIVDLDHREAQEGLLAFEHAAV